MKIQSKPGAKNTGKGSIKAAPFSQIVTRSLKNSAVDFNGIFPYPENSAISYTLNDTAWKWIEAGMRDGFGIV